VVKDMRNRVYELDSELSTVLKERCSD